MMLKVLKRQCLLWGFTSAGLALLLINGLLVSYWVSGSDVQDVGQFIEVLPLGWWRAVAYGLLLVFWSKIIYRLLRNPQPDNQPPTTRRPLIILILLYECLIVQNPLAVLLRLLG